MKLKFELSDARNLSTSYLSRGHLTLEFDGRIYTSKDRKPDQSFKLFFAMIELMDLCSEMNRNAKKKTFEFVAADSSFILNIKKNDQKMTIDQVGEGTFDLKQFATELARAIRELFEIIGMNEENLEALQFDYQDAVKDFNEQFQLSD